MLTFAESDLADAVEYANQEFKYGSENDPNSLRSQLRSVERQSGRTPKELEELIELPESCRQSWHWFWELSNSRTEGFSGSNPIAYSEIKAYFELMRIEPRDFEITLIRSLDIAYLNHQRSKQQK